MRNPIFTGAGVAIVTPFDSLGNLNLKTYERIVNDQIANGTEAIIVCGTTGEACTLTDDEHKNIISATVEYVNGRVPVIAGTGSNDTAYAIELSKFAASEGVDGLLSVTPYYNKTSQRGLIKHFSMIADCSDAPVILYNVPSRTGMNFSIDTYMELAKHPNINGVKEASGDFSLIAKTRALCPEDFYIWSGNDDQTVAMMSLGAKGAISVLSNVAPKISRDIVDACRENDFAKATQIQSKYISLINNLFIEVNPIPAKTGMEILGYDVGELRMPLYEMAPENREKLKNAMILAGLI